MTVRTTYGFPVCTIFVSSTKPIIHLKPLQLKWKRDLLYGFVGRQQSSYLDWHLGRWTLETKYPDERSWKIFNIKKGKGILHIHSIIEYAPDILFIGSDDGLTLFNTVTHERFLYNQYGEDSKNLSDKFIYPILKDKEGGVWIGTYYNGVNYLPPYCGQFSGYSGADGSPYFSSRIISRFCEDDKGRVWIASDDSGLSCFDPLTKQFINFKGREQLSKRIFMHCAPLETIYGLEHIVVGYRF